MIDTAYIYAGEKCEPEVGKAIKAAAADGTVQSRDELFVTTKHWRKFHGYDESLGCLKRSLARLQLDFVDLWLMHWPGPAWNTMNRKNDEIAEHGAWHYALDGHGKDEIAALRAETWRAMEEAKRRGMTREAAAGLEASPPSRALILSDPHPLEPSIYHSSRCRCHRCHKAS